MASVALQKWLTSSKGELDEIEEAHTAVGGTGRGRRYATLQLNYAYAMLVSSQFQRFCRDLHTEAVSALVQGGAQGPFQAIARAILTQGRLLDRGNPNAGNLGADYGRLGMQFWDDIKTHHSRNGARKALLHELTQWRNAIAHQDFSTISGGGTTLHLSTVRKWRKGCSGLAGSMDIVVADHVLGMVGRRPW